MRRAGAAPAITAMLAMSAPAGAASMLMPCDGCGALAPTLHTVPSRKAMVEPNGGLTIAPSSYDDLFRAGHAAARGLTDRWSARVFQAGDSGFSIETVRRVANRAAAPEAIGAHRDKLSAGSMTLRYATGIGAVDTLALGLAAGMEKRRFALDLARGHHVRSQSAGLVASWTHGSAWRLDGGYRADFGSRSATPLERGIQLVQGAARTQRGAWTALSYTIGAPDAARSLSFGLRAQAFRLTEGDRQALGAASRSDARIALTTSFRFR